MLKTLDIRIVYLSKWDHTEKTVDLGTGKQLLQLEENY